MKYFKTHHLHKKYLNKDLPKLNDMSHAGYGEKVPYDDYIKEFIFNDVFVKDNFLTFITKRQIDGVNTEQIEDIDFHLIIDGLKEYIKKQSLKIIITSTETERIIQYRIPFGIKPKTIKLVLNYKENVLSYDLTDKFHYFENLPAGQVVVNTIFWNNWSWVKDWIEYNIELGVDHFFLYYTGVMDNEIIYKSLEKYIHDKKVTLFEWNFPIGHGHEPWNPYNAYAQHSQMAHSLFLSKNKFEKYMCIDPDEYLILAGIYRNNLSLFLEQNNGYDFLLLQGLWFEAINPPSPLKQSTSMSEEELPHSPINNIRKCYDSWKDTKACISTPIKGKHIKNNTWENRKNISNPNVDVGSRLHGVENSDICEPVIKWMSYEKCFYLHFTNFTKKHRQIYHKWVDGKNINYEKIDVPFLKDWYNLSFHEIKTRYMAKGFHDEVSNPL
jgi:hypothetical protein